MKVMMIANYDSKQVNVRKKLLQQMHEPDKAQIIPIKASTVINSANTLPASVPYCPKPPLSYSCLSATLVYYSSVFSSRSLVMSLILSWILPKSRFSSIGPPNS